MKDIQKLQRKTMALIIQIIEETSYHKIHQLNFKFFSIKLTHEEETNDWISFLQARYSYKK